jgi:hypothetical protein
MHGAVTGGLSKDHMCQLNRFSHGWRSLERTADYARYATAAW